MKAKKKAVKIRLQMKCNLPPIEFDIDLITTEQKALKIIKAHKKMIDAITGGCFGGYAKKVLTVKTQIV